MIDKLIRAVLLLIGLFWFAGCGFIQSPSVPSQMVGTTSLNNFDFDGKPTQIQVQGVPERVIVARPEILDALLALHAENHICAAYITRDKVEQIPEELDFASVDVSFISLRLILPALDGLLSPEGEAVCLVKPQFEAGREKVGKKGVVRDPAVHLEVLEAFLEHAKESNFTVLGITYSPIRGPEGNIEYLGYLRHGQGTPGVFSLPEIVEASHSQLKD